MLNMLEDMEDDTKAISARLQAVRTILKLSKREFSERAEISEQVYSPWEKGRRPISLDGAKKLRKRYGISLEFIYFGKTDELPHKIAKELPGKP